MKILTAQQIREADAFTIQNEPILPIDLMERAATKCANWIIENRKEKNVAVFCGVGNNGGDGLVIARFLSEKKYTVKVYIVEFSKSYSPDFITNLDRLKKCNVSVNYLTAENHLFEITKEELIVDAIFGSGLSKPVTGFIGNIIP